MRMRVFRKLTLIIFLAGTACSEIIGHALEYPDAVEFFDEPMFRPLWNDLKACSKLRGDLTDIGFYYVPRETLPTVLHGIRTVGIYNPESHRIFVVQSEMKNPAVIRHEMMHALLRDQSGHPPRYFGYDGLCGYV